MIVQYLILGPENYMQNIEGVRSSARVTVFALRAFRIPGNVWYLIRSGFLLFVVPGSCLALLESRNRSAQGIVRLFLVLFVACWSFWYVCVSVGWHRYAFEAYALGMVFFGNFCIWVLRQISRSHGSLKNTVQHIYILRIVAVSFLVLSAYLVVTGGLDQIRRILNPPPPHAQLFAAYLQESVLPGAVIESWEWELDVLTPGLTYHHPTNDWVDRKTAEIQFGDIVTERYDLFAFSPYYLVDGPFSKWTGLYKEAIADGCCNLVTTIGEYTLYKVNR
jgi:hypothetical protein